MPDSSPTSTVAPSSRSSPAGAQPYNAASLAGLPEELKKLIVLEVKVKPGRYFHPRGRSQQLLPNRDSVRMLGSTSREFYHLCVPEIWDELRLDEGTSASLLYGVEELLPKYGRHVKKLMIQPCRQDNGWLLPQDLEEDEWLSNRTLPLSLVKVAEKLCGVKAGTVPRRVRDLRTRSLLIVAAMRLCPNVEKVEIEQFDPELGGKVPGRTYEVDHPMEELKSTFAPSVTDLTVYFRHKISNSTEHVGQLLTACRNVTSLILVLDFPIPFFFDRTAMGSALLKLGSLKTLVLGWGGVVDDKLLSLPYNLPLSSLVLYDDGASDVHSFSSYCTFFNTLSPTLTKLNWSVAHVPIASNTNFPILPHLVDLTLKTMNDLNILRTFSASPLEYLEIRGSRFIGVGAWSDFVESKKTTLRCVKIFWQAVANETRRIVGFSSSDVLALRTKCDSLGIEFEAPQ